MGKLISIFFFMCQIGKKVVETHSNYRHFGVCFKPSYFKDVPRKANDGECSLIMNVNFSRLTASIHSPLILSSCASLNK